VCGAPRSTFAHANSGQKVPELHWKGARKAHEGIASSDRPAPLARLTLGVKNLQIPRPNDPRRKTCCFARPESTSRPENGDPVSESCIEKASGRVQNVLPKCLNLPCSLYVLEDGAPLTPSVLPRSWTTGWTLFVFLLPFFGFFINVWFRVIHWF
jgi:hypothetical protein